MLPLVLLSLVLLACSHGSTAWDPDAGLVKPLAWGQRTVTVSTNDVAAKANIIDNNDQTQWQSGACFPAGFIGRNDMNSLLNATQRLTVVASAGSKRLDSSFDNSFYTGGYIAAAGGEASISITLTAPTDLYRFYFRGSWNKGLAKLSVILSDGSTVTVAANLNRSINWVDQRARGVWKGVTRVQLVSNDSFTLTELAAQSARCTEWAIMDMQTPHSVNLLRVRWWSPDAVATSLLTSTDGVTWNPIAELTPTVLPSADFWFDDPIQVRYVQIKHLVKEDDWKKVYVWEMSAYGSGGRWGVAPPAVQQTKTFRELLGVNGIWGWGFNSFSDSLVKQGKGPLMYSAVASSGRNYHNMGWDVRSPGRDPKYSTMNKTGTDGQWWLDWGREYKAWKGAGLPVAVTYQFLAKQQPPSAWAEPYAISYDIGYKFGRHFGPTNGINAVASFEAGNEPWDYNATFYQQLLRGFTEGLYAGDPAIKRLPCALQANDPAVEGPAGGNYIGARITQDVATKLDALNLHTYSFYRLQNGTRIAVHPEHPGSSMNGLHNMLSWRTANMPGVPIWVTEWGWDARRPGENCGSTTECVSQFAQAVYGIRGLAILARKGVSLAHWFFYANDDKCNTLYCRSGLRDTLSAGFVELRVYRAFKAFMQAAGSSYFSSAVQEDPQAYVYILGDAAGSPTHVLAWRPIPVGDMQDPADTATVTFDIGFTAPAPTAAVALTGAAPGGYVDVGVPSLSGSSWTMQLSGVPTLVMLT